MELFKRKKVIISNTIAVEAEELNIVSSVPAKSNYSIEKKRINSIDFLRGLVMILMVLDHTRDFFSSSGIDPRDVNEPVIFLTRWITHFCAPVFIFLAGMSAFLYGNKKGRSKKELSIFLVTRGFWLVLIELTIVRIGWFFNLNFDFIVLQVIWAIGISMIFLAGIIHLPKKIIGLTAFVMIFGHNLLDGISSADFQKFSWLWILLHEQNFIVSTPSFSILVIYPVIPWIGVMAAGYLMGEIMIMDKEARKKILINSGLFLISIFVIFRFTNFYGDPAPWETKSNFLSTILSFINAEKYPPSLLYLSMTLGPALIALALFENIKNKFSEVVTIFGKVPFFFYIAHIYLIHIFAIFFAEIFFGKSGWLIGGVSIINKPEEYGFNIIVVYLIWFLVILTLYPLCKWFAGIKQTKKSKILSYL